MFSFKSCCFLGERYVVDIKISLGGDRFAIGGQGVGSGCLAQGGQPGLVQTPGNTLCKIDAVAIIGHITVLLVVDHLGDATDVKAHTWHAAGHRLDDGVGQVILQ